MGQIEVKDLLALGHDQMFDALQRGQRSFAFDGLLGGVLNRVALDVVRRKKLLRAFTALSSGAEVLPAERC